VLGESRHVVWKAPKEREGEGEEFPYFLERARSGMIKVCRGREFERDASLLEIFLANENRLLADQLRRTRELLDALLKEQQRPILPSVKSWQPRPD
jgi:hypothetical protein